MSEKIKFFKITLYLGAAYLAIGAIAHFFCLTIFPFYEGKLCAPYHDLLISLSALIISLFLFSTARDPIANRKNIPVIIWASVLAEIFNLWIIFRINFVVLGGPDKKIQTVAEFILLGIFLAGVIFFRPKSYGKQ